MEVINIEKKNWWAKKRWPYNKGLIIAGISAFILYAVLGSYLIAPYDTEFEITLFTIFFQGVGYLFMIGVANICYSIGYSIDKRFNKSNAEEFRIKLYRLGYWFSFGLPFLVPLLVVIDYFVEYAK